MFFQLAGIALAIVGWLALIGIAIAAVSAFIAFFSWMDSRG